MPQTLRRRRVTRAGLGLAIVLALGFAADALVLMSTRAHADAAHPRGASGNDQRLALVGSLPRAIHSRGSDAWTMGMVGVTLVLAVCGGLIAAGRRLMPSGAGAAMQVVGRVSLSPKHAVFMLRVGQRVLLVGVGPQGAPALISELDGLAEIEPEPPRGEQA